MKPNWNAIPESQKEFLKQCPASTDCSYANFCKLANIHKQCGLFRTLLLEKLKLDRFPEGAKIDYMESIAYGKNN